MDDLVDDKWNGQVIARGNVEIRFFGAVLLADEVVYDRGARKLSARGNVTLDRRGRQGHPRGSRQPQRRYARCLRCLRAPPEGPHRSLRARSAREPASRRLPDESAAVEPRRSSVHRAHRRLGPVNRPTEKGSLAGKVCSSASSRTASRSRRAPLARLAVRVLMTCRLGRGHALPQRPCTKTCAHRTTVTLAKFRQAPVLTVYPARGHSRGMTRCAAWHLGCCWSAVRLLPKPTHNRPLTRSARAACSRRRHATERRNRCTRRRTNLIYETRGKNRVILRRMRSRCTSTTTSLTADEVGLRSRHQTELTAKGNAELKEPDGSMTRADRLGVSP